MWEQIKTPVKNVLFLCIAAVLGGLAVAAWLYFAKTPPPDHQAKQGEVIVQGEHPKAAKVGKRNVPPPREITAYDKPQLSGVLKMPELMFTPGEPVATASIKPHTGPTTVVTMLDNEGVAHTVSRQEKTPFWDLKREFRLQGRYLFSGRNLAEADLVVNPVRVGPVNILAGVGAELDREDSSLRGRAFVGFEYRF